ncbi:MAG TPA: translation initiation factor IF-2, partial [Thermoanaerobacter sp.]|nr:translation initiation factor IF-2 [Thermoanaerobacter sp.]HCD09302.1 translation initiation factor IF-2 [Thermoanaerobacter sp.]
MEVNNMSKTRVYELAKELNLSSKDLISKLNDLDIKVKNHMSTLEDEEVELIMDLLRDKPQQTEEVHQKEEEDIFEDNLEDIEEERVYKKSFKKGSKKNKKNNKK